MKKTYIRYCYIITWLLLASCKHYLDARPDVKLEVPVTIRDLQLLMDDYATMNNTWPAAGGLMADNFYLAAADWNTLQESDRKLYIWQRTDQTNDYWNGPYQAILNTNVVLENIDKARSTGSVEDWNNLKGTALFFRAKYFHALAQLFAKPYDPATAAQDPGIPLRYTSNYNDPTVRASVAQTYDRILLDLKAALTLLPGTPIVKSRPGKPAAYGALALVCLDMRDYARAGAYADSCLQLYNRLMDYNELDTLADAPVPRFNDEVIFEMISQNARALLPAVCKVDTLLYNTYAENDLRKLIYFTGNSFKGDYAGMGADNGYIFAGIVTDEMYLVRAESRARAGNATQAMNDLNALLVTRWRQGTFVPLIAADAADALKQILRERRKELLFRSARWADLRRLQYETAFAVTPQRILNGKAYTLPPNSPRYVLQIPGNVVSITGIEQNP